MITGPLGAFRSRSRRARSRRVDGIGPAEGGVQGLLDGGVDLVDDGIHHADGIPIIVTETESSAAFALETPAGSCRTASPGSRSRRTGAFPTMPFFIRPEPGSFRSGFRSLRPWGSFPAMTRRPGFLAGECFQQFRGLVVREGAFPVHLQDLLDLGLHFPVSPISGWRANA